MDTVKHLLSFVSNQTGDMVSVHMDRDGISLLIDRLTRLRELIDQGECEDCHLRTAECAGIELSSTKLAGNQEETTVVQHVKLYAWTNDWAKEHCLIEIEE